MIIQLEKEFIGTGEVKGFKFCQIKKREHGFIYEINQGVEKYHFEVFKQKLYPLCINFEKNIYSEVDFKVVYPKSNNFGVWAWTTNSLEKAEEILKSFIK